MHISAVLIGGVLGFVGGLAAYFGLGFGLFASILIWAGSGPLTVLVLALHMLLQPAQDPNRDVSQAETA